MRERPLVYLVPPMAAALYAAVCLELPVPVSYTHLHRRHAGVDEQKRRVVLRDERKARQAEMTLGFKETEVHLAQLVESSVLHIN